MPDRRVKRTQYRLAEALIALTLEKGYEAVTIRDLTDRAALGYATFFRHYRAKDDLLQDVLDVVLDELTTLLAPVQADADPVAVGVLLFRYVQGHSAVVRVLLGSPSVLQRLVAVVSAQIVHDHAPRPGSPVPLAVAAHHFVSATIALVAWWLAQQMADPPEQMGEIYAALIAQPTSALAFAAPDPAAAPEPNPGSAR